MNEIQCANEDTLRAYAMGTVAVSHTHATESHLETCPRCQESLESLLEAGDELIEGLRSLKHTRRDEETYSESGHTPTERSSDIPAIVGDEEIRSAFRSQSEYELLERIGQGGMGQVWRATHRKLEKQFAIKLIRNERIGQRYSERFLREIRATGKFDHDNVVRATDAGEIAGMLYIAMELVDGVDARKLTRKFTSLSVADVAAIIRQAALGLAHIHEHGLLHRDIKPSNLIVSQKGIVKILDAGLAKRHAETGHDDALTGTGDVIGTPDYMSPEQWSEPDQVTPSADIYSLGCTLFTLLEGRPPFATPQYNSVGKKMQAHLNASPPAIERNDVPRKLRDLLQRMLAKVPSRRPQNAMDVALALDSLAKESNLQAKVRGENTPNAPKALPQSNSSGFGGINRTSLAAVLFPIFLVATIVIIIRIESDKSSSETPSDVSKPAAVVDDRPTSAAKESRVEAGKIACHPSTSIALLAAKNGSLQLVDQDSGDVVARHEITAYRNKTFNELPIHPNPIAEWSPDGKLLAIAFQNDTRIYLFRNGIADPLVIPFRSDPSGIQPVVRSISWHPRGDRLMIAGGIGISIVDTNGKILKEWFDAKWDVNRAQWFPNGTNLLINDLAQTCPAVLGNSPTDFRTVEFETITTFDVAPKSNRALLVQTQTPGETAKLGWYDLTRDEVTPREIELDVRSVAWSPDGEKLAVYVAKTTSELQIYTRDMERIATFVTGHLHAIDWTSDSSHLMARTQSGYHRFSVSDRTMTSW